MLKKKVWLVLPLVAILLSGCNRNTGDRSSENMKKLALAYFMYNEAHQDTLPDMSTPATVKEALLPYVSPTEQSGDIFVNPSTGRPYQPNTLLSNMPDANFDAPSITILFYEDTPYDDGMRGVVYADGHYGTVPESDWAAFFATHTNPVQESTTPSNY